LITGSDSLLILQALSVQEVIDEAFHINKIVSLPVVVYKILSPEVHLEQGFHVLLLVCPLQVLDLDRVRRERLGKRSKPCSGRKRPLK
jgi:hypothetical protein